MKTRNWFCAGAVVALALGVSACGSAGSGGNQATSNTGTGGTSGQSMVLRLADNQPADYPTVLGDNEFAKLVNERTNGRIQIKVYPNAQLGDENTVIQQIQLGAIDFGRINTAPLASYDKDIGVFSLPYLFSSSDQMWKVLNGPIGQQLLDSLQSAKMVGLTYYDSGARNFYDSKRPIVHPSDLKGLKIRVQQSNIFVDLVNTLGGSATPMAYGEVFNALQTGVIDGAENNWPSYYTTNHYKVAKYITEDEHTRNPEVLLASQATWNKLSPQDQQIIRQAAVESQQVERQAWAQLEQKAKDAVKANGNVITEVQDVSEWQQAVQPLYDKYGKDYKTLIDQIRATK
ncbi:TRAP transporter substrate-binding protein [Alicyclobacillus sp.]|uniref:TRAP transporter substrate-binding protein n=1 Tax=Alicyclobacillus sp. TaxID=61169 RepID=UPI0025C0AAF8|nr:TRAP transporter substrate-binding protein [Alicyclobacillus sp.]MCL6515494.1 TRAP transporter substrate-binding protein [Alicyclobacillus sp.]